MNFDQFFDATEYKFPRALRLGTAPIPVPIDEVIKVVAEHAGNISKKLTRYEIGKSLIGNYDPRENNNKTSYDKNVVQYFRDLDKDVLRGGSPSSNYVPHAIVDIRINENLKALEIARRCISALRTLADNKVADVNIYKTDEAMKDKFLRSVGVTPMGDSAIGHFAERDARENVMLQIIRQAQKFKPKLEAQPKPVAA